MAPFSYAWLVWVTMVTLGEASAGDRDEMYLTCLDTCVEELCGIKYTREESDVEYTLQQRRQQQHLQLQLRQHLLQLKQQQQRSRQPEDPGPAAAPLTTDTTAPREGGGTHDGNDGVRRDLGAVGGNRGQGTSGEKSASAAAAAAVASGGGDAGGGSDGGGGEVRFAGGRDAGGDGGLEGRGAGEGQVERERVVDRYIHAPPWYLRAMGWDCESECRYSCMTLHVEARIKAGERVLQYYGKWPFRRVWGIQELFASLFSAGNGLPHLYHLLFSSGQYNPRGNYMRFWLTLYPWVGINTWLWSTVFHARDVRWTEAADYFCALLNIFFVVWVAIMRVAGPPKSRSPRVRKWVPLAGVAISVYYFLHICFMWFVKFDYGYNMKVALVAGVLHTGLWLRYQYNVRERPYAKRGALIIILLNAAILLEVGDFPPVAYRLVDAHAIWHMVTVPLMFWWYRFVIQDARHESLLSAGKATQ